MPDEPCFEVASGDELRKKYSLTAANRPTFRLDPAQVPERFRQWIPLAERWGISDDLIREDSVRTATRDELQDLMRFRGDYEAVLSEWLAKPESCGPQPTKEYIAFSCLGVAFDEAVSSSQP